MHLENSITAPTPRAPKRKRRSRALAVRERDIEAYVQGLLELDGWRCFHFEYGYFEERSDSRSSHIPGRFESAAPRRRRDQISLFWEKNRNYGLFVGPGEKLVLLTPDARALFVWRKFRSADRQVGVNCAVFRNEGAGLASELIRHADDFAWHRWPGERLYTYVNPKKVISRNPGYCFLMAGWRKCGFTKSKRLLILECFPDPMTIPEIQDTAECITRESVELVNIIRQALARSQGIPAEVVKYCLTTEASTVKFITDLQIEAFRLGVVAGLSHKEKP